jgi:hypothetical protein
MDSFKVTRYNTVRRTLQLLTHLVFPFVIQLPGASFNLSRQFAHVRPQLRSLLHLDSPTRESCCLSSLLVALPHSLRFSVKCKHFALPLELVVKSPLLHFVRMCAFSNERCACRSHDRMRDLGGETKEMTWTSEGGPHG